jgi:hypothetical protein
MKLEEAFKIVMKEAESSAHKKSVVCGETLKAIEMLRNFYKHYGHFFAEYREMLDAVKESSFPKK